MIKFTQITISIKYPAKVRSKLIKYHSDIISTVMEEFKNTRSYKRKVIDAMNIISYTLVSDDYLPTEWRCSSPFDNLPDIDMSDVESVLKSLDMFIDVDSIDWDVEEVLQPSSMYVPKVDRTASKSYNSVSKDPIEVTTNMIKSSAVTINKKENSSEDGDLIELDTVKDNVKLKLSNQTPKEDLYIQYPVIPRYSVKDIFASGRDGADVLCIYKTYPEVPTRQSGISVTTDVNKFTDADLMNLYPKQFIQTRSAKMYDPVDGLDFHEDLGVILPILNYSRQELIDNLIKYPHIYQLTKCIDDNYVNFYSTIEIDGELHKIVDVWDELSDTRRIPKIVEFMKEYVVRRYLLERDVSNIDHKYKLRGTLDPYLTLFTTPDDYMRFGHKDVLEIARQCVMSRVSYRQSRNPVLRRLESV